MNTNQSWNNKPAGSQKSGFGAQPGWGGQGSFSQPNVPKPPVYRPTSNFGQPATPKPPVYGPPPSLGAAGPFAHPKPITPLSRPWDPKPVVLPAFGVSTQPAKRNAWGDINGDGQEDDWDDVLGDGLLLDAMEAQARAQRGAPPEPEDEFLIGRRSRSPAARSSASGGAALIVALGVLCVLGLVGFACFLSLMGSAY